MIPVTVLLLFPTVACRPLELAFGDVSELLEVTVSLIVSPFWAVAGLFSKALFFPCFSGDFFTCCR